MLSATLYCCVHFPSFRLQVAELDNPHFVGQAFALASPENGILASIEALSLPARRMRIPPQIRVSDLQARWPQVPILSPEFKSEQERISQILAIANSHATTSEFKLDTLFMSFQNPEPVLWAQNLIALLIKNSGLQHTRSAIANTPHTAELLARATRQSTPILCPQGFEREWIAKIPLRFLHHVPPRIHTRFRLYNLSTLGDIQRLDRKYLKTHFGSEGEQLYAISQGLLLTSTSSLAPKTLSTQSHCAQMDLFAISPIHSTHNYETALNGSAPLAPSTKHPVRKSQALQAS